MAPFFAFLHHIAAFALVSALVLEFVLIRDDLTVKTARKIRYADLVYGVSAGAILVAGLLRVYYFEKGPAFYFHNIFFMIKFALFIMIALLSIYPTVEFLSWRKPLASGQMPAVKERKKRSVRAIIHVEMALVLFLVLCAALMAKGLGYRG